MWTSSNKTQTKSKAWAPEISVKLRQLGELGHKAMEPSQRAGPSITMVYPGTLPAWGSGS